MAAKPLVIANWKMNPSTWRDAKRLLDATKKAAERAPSQSVVVCPPSIYLRDLRAAYKGKWLAYGVQHAHFNPSGAHTGETSLAQAKDSGASYVIVGHAERRELGESNDDTRKKVAAALALKMTPVLCVGERERASGGEHFGIVKDQLRAAFSDVAPGQVTRVIVVYEPLWTIGKDAAMSPRDMHEMGIFIRKTIVDFPTRIGAPADPKAREAAMKLRILYGGSVTDKNAADMLRLGDVQGFLVGGASQEAARMANLLQAIENAT